MKKDAKAAGEALTPRHDTDNVTDDGFVEDEMSNVAESETSEHEDSADEQVAREVADDGADFTTAKNDGDVNATRRMKRKRDLEEAAPPAPSVGDTEDEDTVETPSEKKHCSSRQAAQDAELMGAVPADDRTEPTELPRAHSDSTITVSKTTVNEPATTTPLSSTASAPVDNARATFRSRFPDLQTYMKSLHGDLPNIPPHLAVHKARKQT
ncbi:hypothetical protein P171DRAFT_413002 [Karstenula rhodostoma CBS 690.94]|uniref:Uncharacterized protein n=1 Tax=Karstenula rhodostoma CBS 690.94 TaxID=1392251 RepID=A0A9P4PH75_9PLEO|nr:hypothetical protein P171DRAFT_413002 [Karstenula rhodostoma CBS 690.94]